jgi:hypothetical protein
MRPRLPALLLSFSLSALGGCVTTGSKPPPPPLTEEQKLATEVARLSSEAEALLKAQSELVWKYWAEGARADVASTYVDRSGLFSLDNIRNIDRQRQRTTDPRELRALTALQSHFAGEYLSQQLAEVNDAIANLEASLSFPVDGREVRWRELERLLANEKSAVKRKALYTAATPALERLNQLLRRREERTEQLVRELGYPSYEAFGGELRQADLAQLGLLAEEVLQATEAPYKQVMERLSQRELGLPFASLTRADLPRLFRPRGVDGLFPKDKQLARAHATLTGMGLDLWSMKNVRIDARDDVPRKNPRPLTLGIGVPGDVRMSMRPVEGALEASRLMHEVGHALHYAFTKESRFELARLGNPTVTEAHAALFEDLMEDPVWLEEYAGLSGQERTEYLAAASAHKLFLIRRAAGRLLYQLAVHRQEGADTRELYKALIARTDAMPATDDDTARYLVDQEDFYQSADNFRAWFLAGQLQGQLKARFGPSWWHSPEAGTFLQGLWTHGNALSAREVAQAMGESAIAPDVLLLRLGTTLQVPVKLDARGEQQSPKDEAPTPTAPASAPEPTPAAPVSAPAAAPSAAKTAPAHKPAPQKAHVSKRSKPTKAKKTETRRARTSKPPKSQSPRGRSR